MPNKHPLRLLLLTLKRQAIAVAATAADAAAAAAAGKGVRPPPLLPLLLSIWGGDARWLRRLLLCLLCPRQLSIQDQPRGIAIEVQRIVAGAAGPAESTAIIERCAVFN